MVSENPNFWEQIRESFSQKYLTAPNILKLFQNSIKYMLDLEIVVIPLASKESTTKVISPLYCQLCLAYGERVYRLEEKLCVRLCLSNIDTTSTLLGKSLDLLNKIIDKNAPVNYQSKVVWTFACLSFDSALDCLNINRILIPKSLAQLPKTLTNICRHLSDSALESKIREYMGNFEIQLSNILVSIISSELFSQEDLQQLEASSDSLLNTAKEFGVDVKAIKFYDAIKNLKQHFLEQNVEAEELKKSHGIHVQTKIL
jgi:hypothetical protein